MKCLLSIVFTFSTFSYFCVKLKIENLNSRCSMMPNFLISRQIVGYSMCSCFHESGHLLSIVQRLCSPVRTFSLYQWLADPI